MMETVRTHSRGRPFTRDIPVGCQSKSAWQELGYLLRHDAKPAAWILMGDNYHEFAVFSADQVIEGYIVRVPKVSYDKLEKLFERYSKLVPYASGFTQSPGHYFFSHIDGTDDNGNIKEHIVELSGHYDRRSGRMTSRGSREKAYARLLKLVAIAEEKVSHAQKDA